MHIHNFLETHQKHKRVLLLPFYMVQPKKFENIEK